MGTFGFRFANAGIRRLRSLHKVVYVHGSFRLSGDVGLSDRDRTGSFFLRSCTPVPTRHGSISEIDERGRS